MRTNLEKDLLLVQVYHPQKTRIGDFIYRIEQPAIAMARVQGVAVININAHSPHLQDLCLQADVLLLHMVSDQDFLPILEMRKKQDLPTVFEISDNFVAFQAHDPMAPYFNDPLNLSTVFLYASLADAVQVTTEELIDTFSFLNDRFKVFRNHLMDSGDFCRERSNDFTLGWAGSYSHLEDLKWIAPTVVEFLKKHPNVRFSLMGTKRGMDYFSGIPDRQKSYRPTGSLSDYYRFLETIDVGLAPLLNTAYNRCRSDIKFLEYGSRGVTPVLSAHAPYQKTADHGVTALLFKDEIELRKLLKELAEDPENRYSISRNAYEYVRSSRQEQIHASERIKFYASLSKVKTPKGISYSILEPIAQDSKAYRVKESEAEKLSSHASSLFEEGDSQNGLESYKRAIQNMPEFYIPYYWLGESLFREGSVDCIGFLERASKLSTASLRPKLLLGLALLSKNTDAASACFKDALKVSPFYAPALDALARIEEQRGRYQKAAEFFKLALKVNPFYSLAALGLGRNSLAMGKKEGAIPYLQIADDVLPNHVESRLELAKLFLKAGKNREAARQCQTILAFQPDNIAALTLLSSIDENPHPKNDATDDLKEPSPLSVEGLDNTSTFSQNWSH